MKKEDSKEAFVNPIDKDKIAENPSLLPYASNIGSAIIRPLDKGKVKGLAMNAMYEQTEVHLNQLREQVETLIKQAKEVHERVEISETIYLAEMGFDPIVGRFYHLYLRKNGKKVLSMVAPHEWGKNCPYEFEATVKLLSDHTWEVMEINKD
ncbi:MAG: DUF2452 domain-containing protein [Bacteroidetes bacterium]|jgi:hypothetical protein|nr:DUF2452 domain-containing protein [Bacteroidota bacterium]MDF1868362.1 DUF2452 domain-containing protein [Saprospiraceae bacterium]